MNTPIDGSWYHKAPDAPEQRAAGGIVVRLVDGRPLIALVRERDGPAYVLPKGRVEPGEMPEDAARREIREEAGLVDLELVADLGVRARYDFRKTHWKVTHYFLFRTEQAVGTPTDDRHPYHLDWFPAEAPPPLFWPEQAELVSDNLERIRALAAPARREGER